MYEVGAKCQECWNELIDKFTEEMTPYYFKNFGFSFFFLTHLLRELCGNGTKMKKVLTMITSLIEQNDD